MTTRLTRTRSVLMLRDVGARLNDTGPHVMYGRAEEDERDAPDYRAVLIDEDTRRDLGDPDEITVTIYPGDLLNAEAPAPEDGDIDAPTFGDASFEPIERADGKWDWRLRHQNGEILCGSSQGYETRSMAFEIGRRCLSGGYVVTAEEWA